MAKRTQTRFLARTVHGSNPADMPGFIPPQLATLRSKSPVGDQWAHEIKFDGYRLQAHLNQGRATIFTRNGLDWTNRFSGIAKGFGIPVERAIFDGEAVVITDGRTNFSDLQADIASGRQSRIVYYVFDLLFLEGFDLRDSPLSERKRILKSLFDETQLASPILYSEHFAVDGATMYKQACTNKWEGIISKDLNSPYRSTRTEAWLKVKCVMKSKFYVVGYVPDPAGIAALHLAKKSGKKFEYIGRVGTGFTRASSLSVRKQLQPFAVPKSVLAKQPRAPKAVWVEPKFQATVEYRDITSEGLLRQASFKGLVTAGR